VGAPGQKDFHSGITLTQALLASGGATKAAGSRIRVLRAGADGRLSPIEYNLTEIENGVVPDPLLQPGDRIEVASAPVRKR
jgi:protein involved in polysaccharide export with SLBB domain